MAIDNISHRNHRNHGNFSVRACHGASPSVLSVISVGDKKILSVGVSQCISTRAHSQCRECGDDSLNHSVQNRYPGNLPVA